MTRPCNVNGKAGKGSPVQLMKPVRSSDPRNVPKTTVSILKSTFSLTACLHTPMKTGPKASMTPRRRVVGCRHVSMHSRGACECWSLRCYYLGFGQTHAEAVPGQRAGLRCASICFSPSQERTKPADLQRKLSVIRLFSATPVTRLLVSVEMTACVEWGRVPQRVSL